MIKKAYIINVNSLRENEFDIFWNLGGQHETPIVIEVKTIKESFAGHIDLKENTSNSEILDEDIQYMRILLNNVGDCEYVIVK